MDDIKPDKFKTNPFAKKYKQTLAMRDMDKQAKGAGVPSVLRRKALGKAKK